MTAEADTLKKRAGRAAERIRALNENQKFAERMAMISNILLVLFLFLITLGSYRKIKTAVLIVYLCISVVFALLSLKRMWREFIGSPIMILWLIYCISGLLSSIFIKHEEDFYIVYTQVSFTFILFTLTRFWEPRNFARLFRFYVLFFLLCAFFQELTGVTVFRFLKEGTPFPYVDPKTRGITAVFEYRHYFGCYLLAAFFSLFYFPEEKKILNIVFGIVLGLGIVITYTRSVWIAWIVCLIVLFACWLYMQTKSEQKHKRIRGKRVVFTIFAAAVIIFLLVLLYPEQTQAIYENVVLRVEQAFDPTTGSFRVRVYNAQHGIAYILEHWQKNIWIGMGNGSALEWLQTDEGASWRKAIDCQYVTTLMETGLVGALSLFAMIFQACVYIFHHTKEEVRWCGISFLSICLAFFFFEVIVVSSSIFVLFMLVLCGLCPRREPEHTVLA